MVECGRVNVDIVRSVWRKVKGKEKEPNADMYNNTHECNGTNPQGHDSTLDSTQYLSISPSRKSCCTSFR
jgi:hypothetical protein